MSGDRCINNKGAEGSMKRDCIGSFGEAEQNRNLKRQCLNFIPRPPIYQHYNSNVYPPFHEPKSSICRNLESNAHAFANDISSSHKAHAHEHNFLNGIINSPNNKLGTGLSLSQTHDHKQQIIALNNILDSSKDNTGKPSSKRNQKFSSCPLHILQNEGGLNYFNKSTMSERVRLTGRMGENFGFDPLEASRHILHNNHVTAENDAFSAAYHKTNEMIAIEQQLKEDTKCYQQQIIALENAYNSLDSFKESPGKPSFNLNQLISSQPECLQNEVQNNYFTKLATSEKGRLARSNNNNIRKHLLEDYYHILNNNTLNAGGNASSVACLRDNTNIASECTLKDHRYLFHDRNRLPADLIGVPRVNYENHSDENEFNKKLRQMSREYPTSYPSDLSYLSPLHNGNSLDLKALHHQQEKLFLDRRSSYVCGLPTHFRGRSNTMLGTAEDKMWLSPFFCFLRSKCIEVFIAKDVDVSYRSCAKKKITLGQVGLRCCFCAHKPYSERGKRSSSFPSSKSRIYQSVNMMIHDHFHNCAELPQVTREHYYALKEDTRRGEVESKKYWEESATKLGIMDTPKGMFLSATHPELTSSQLV